MFSLMDAFIYNRIDYKGPLEPVLKKVCLDFAIGSYQSHEFVPFGYEDFNVVLTTNKGIYFVKIFGSFRSEKECEQYVHTMEFVYKNSINYPFLYKAEGQHLYYLEIDGVKIRLVVQEFIDGQNFIQLSAKPTKKEKEFIIQQAALINKLDYKPMPIYDSWAIVNFEKEYQKRSGHLLKNQQVLLKNILDNFLKCSIDTLPHCFVHGDMMASNIMKDKNSKIYILDFAVSQYYPRIVELAVLICCNFFDPNNPKSLREVFNFTLQTYQKFITLEEIELKTLPLFIEATFAMYLLRANYEKLANKNNGEENEYWLRVATAGLRSKL